MYNLGTYGCGAFRPIREGSATGYSRPGAALQREASSVTSSIGFYASQTDQGALDNFAASLGLRLVSPTLGQPVNSAELGPFCFLTAVEESDLHPYGLPPVRLTDALDPMLGYMRSYFKSPYLVCGHIQYSDDVRVLAQATRPYYSKLSGWIKAKWTRLPGGGFYIGDEAQRLVEAGAQLVNALPGTYEFQRIEVPASKSR